MMPAQQLTLRQVLSQAIGDLKAAGLETALLDAQLLLAFVLGRSRTALIASSPAEFLSEEEYTRYRSLVERRRGGECVAYIRGTREFWGIDFRVNQAVLVPRPETETLVEAALSCLEPDSEATVLDLCTGSGVVALSLKHERPACTVYAADISKEALEVARENARRLGEHTIQCIQSDLFETITGSFDLITANPPYIPTERIRLLPPEVQHEPVLALDGGFEGLSVIRQIIVQALGYLAPEADLLLEADPSQMPAIGQLLSVNGYRDIRIWKDLGAHERVIGGKAGR